MNAARSAERREAFTAAVLRSASSIAILSAVTAVAIYLLLALTTSHPLDAMSSLLSGPLDRPGRTGEWIADSTNLALTGLAVAIVFRVGQFSLGAEGQVALGALAAGAVVLEVGPFPGLWCLGLLAGAVAGFAWGAVPGVLKAYAKADEIVSTLMLNFVALALFAVLIKEFLQPPDAGYVVSDFIPGAGQVPSIGSDLVVSLATPAAVLLCIVAWWALRWTRLGFAFRMTGSNPRYARSVGLAVERSTWLSMAISGAVAGLAGAFVVEAQSGRQILGLSANLGYDGILVALIAANRPLAVPFAALAYGYLRTGGDVAQISSNIPRELITTVQGLLILIVTARFGGLGTSFAALRRRFRPPTDTSAQATLEPQGG